MKGFFHSLSKHLVAEKMQTLKFFFIFFVRTLYKHAAFIEEEAKSHQIWHNCLSYEIWLAIIFWALLNKPVGWISQLLLMLTALVKRNEDEREKIDDDDDNFLFVFEFQFKLNKINAKQIEILKNSLTQLWDFSHTHTRAQRS